MGDIFVKTEMILEDFIGEVSKRMAENSVKGFEDFRSIVAGILIDQYGVAKWQSHDTLFDLENLVVYVDGMYSDHMTYDYQFYQFYHAVRKNRLLHFSILYTREYGEDATGRVMYDENLLRVVEHTSPEEVLDEPAVKWTLDSCYENPKTKEARVVFRGINEMLFAVVKVFPDDAQYHSVKFWMVNSIEDVAKHWNTLKVAELDYFKNDYIYLARLYLDDMIKEIEQL